MFQWDLLMLMIDQWMEVTRVEETGLMYLWIKDGLLAMSVGADMSPSFLILTLLNPFLPIDS